MRKACQVCGFRNPAAEQSCAMCGATLPAGTGMLAGARCCPAPGCVELAVPPPARYCPLCGAELKPVSSELWAAKFVEPSLESDFVAAFEDPSGLLREAAEMGLPENEAEARLDAAFATRAGATRSVLQQWVSEYDGPQGEDGGDAAAARSAALAHADELNISPAHAELILDASAFGRDTPTVPPDAETPSRDPVQAGPAAVPPSDTRPGAGARNDEPPVQAESVTATTTSNVRRRHPVPKDDRAAEGSARVIENSLPTTVSFDEEKEKSDVSSGRKRRMILGAALVCVGVILIAWFVSMWAARDAVRVRPPSASPINSPPAVADTPPAATADATPSPAAEVAASPAASPTNDTDVDEAELTADRAGVLVLFTNADDVTVSINGRRRGVISRGSPASFRLTPGTQAVVATTQGHEQYKERLSLEAGEKRNLFVAMRPLTGPTPLARERARRRLQAAQGLFQRRKYQEALQEVNEGLRLDPGNGELQRLRQNIEAAAAEPYRPRSQPTPQQPSGGREYREPELVIQAPPRYVPPPPPTPERYEAPYMTRKHQPSYPQIARDLRVAGAVAVNVTVNESGGATHAEAVSGPMLLRRTAIDAAMRSAYSPARRNGQPVSSTLTVNFVFKLY